MSSVLFFFATTFPGTLRYFFLRPLWIDKAFRGVLLQQQSQLGEKYSRAPGHRVGRSRLQRIVGVELPAGLALSQLAMPVLVSSSSLRFSTVRKAQVDMSDAFRMNNRHNLQLASVVFVADASKTAHEHDLQFHNYILLFVIISIESAASSHLTLRSYAYLLV